MINDVADEVIQELFKSLKNRDKNNLESINGSEFVFDYIPLLYCKCHKINKWWWILYIYSGGSCIDSLDWIKSNNKSYQLRR